MNRTRTSKNAKRLLVWLLLLTMVFGLLPMAAFADEAGEPVVIEEPVQEPEPLSESTEAPSEPTQEPETIPEPEHPGNAAVTIEGDEEQPEEEPTDEEPVDEEENQTIEALPYVPAPFSVDASNPIRVFHLDCGRKYFSAADIIAIIDLLAENNYTHLELAIGNEGLRFLFEDMSITANDKTYDGAKIKNAIISYNNNTGSSGYLSEADMESIFTEANKKGISIIPLLNSPGHMNAIIAAMEAVDMTNVRYKVKNGWGQDLVSNRTIDLTNTVAVNFTQALIEKYAAYFQNKGCKYFNIGTDEYANDLTIGNTSYGGFASLSDDGYSKFVTYVNNIDNIVKAHGIYFIVRNPVLKGKAIRSHCAGRCFVLNDDLVRLAVDLAISRTHCDTFNSQNSFANVVFVLCGEAVEFTIRCKVFIHLPSRSTIRQIICSPVGAISR